MYYLETLMDLLEFFRIGNMSEPVSLSLTALWRHYRRRNLSSGSTFSQVDPYGKHCSRCSLLRKPNLKKLFINFETLMNFIRVVSCHKYGQSNKFYPHRSRIITEEIYYRVVNSDRFVLTRMEGAVLAHFKEQYRSVIRLSFLEQTGHQDLENFNKLGGVLRMRMRQLHTFRI